MWKVNSWVHRVPSWELKLWNDCLSVLTHLSAKIFSIILCTTGCQDLASYVTAHPYDRTIITMNATQNNILSRLEREYISFLYDNARRSSNVTVTISQIEEFISTPEGQKGLQSFSAMRKTPKPSKQPERIGAFL